MRHTDRNITRYALALGNQPTYAPLETPLVQGIAVVLYAVGATLVLTSMYALGVTGTYLGKFLNIEWTCYLLLLQKKALCIRVPGKKRTKQLKSSILFPLFIR